MCGILSDVGEPNADPHAELRDVLRRAARLRRDQQQALDQTLAFERQLLINALGTDLRMNEIAAAAQRPREFVRRLEQAWYAGELADHPPPDGPRVDRRRTR